MLVVLEPAQRHVHVPRIRRRKAILREGHLGAHVEKVGGLVVVPATIGQKVAVVVHRYAAQAIAAQVLGDVGVLQGELAGLANVERHRRIADLALAIGVPAKTIFAIGIGTDAVADAPIVACRAGGFERGRTEGLITHLQLHPTRGLMAGLAGDVVDDATGFTTAIQRTGRAFEYFHAFDVEQLRHREAGIRIAAQSVVQHVFLAESAQGDARIAEETDAADAAIQVGDLPRRLVVDQLARQHLHRLRHQRQRRIGACGHCGVFGLVERLRTADDIDAIQLGDGC